MRTTSANNSSDSSVGEASPPDWEAMDGDIVCPLCGYNLRGLVEPRCPECGSRYSWSELLDERRRTHPYLFEHHPERNVRSFIRTWMAGLNPDAFWSSLNPIQRIASGRLTIYALVIAALSYGAFALSMAAYYLKEDVLTAYGLGPIADWEYVYDATLQSLGSGGWSKCYALPLMWAVLTALSLNLFLVSLRRAGMQFIQVLRVVVYVADLMVWLWLTMAVAHLATGACEWLWVQSGNRQLPPNGISFLFAALWIFVRGFPALGRWWRPRRLLANLLAILIIAGLTLLFDNIYRDWASWIGTWTAGPVYTPILALACFLFAQRLIIACQRYLRLERGRTIALLSQVVALLAVLCAISLYRLHRFGGLFG